MPTLLVSSSPLGLAAAMLAAAPAFAAPEPWFAAPEIVRGEGGGDTIRGVVFDDTDGDGRHGEGEAGIEGVLVTNGLEVVRTDADGRYEIAVRPDMDLSVVQPSGWRVPTDERLVPQFAYVHKEGGTPESLRFGGLHDTGAAPEAVNFPLRRLDAATSFACAVLGDSQSYSGHETSQYRDSAVADIAAREWGEADCILYLGDVVGDDLDLLDRLLEVGAAAGLPQWAVAGNHDFDFDATDDAHSLDSWRNRWGPAYFAFEIGDVLFVGLDNIVYPCGPDDAEGHEGREACVESERPAYTAHITDTQIEWLGHLLAETDEDKLVVLAHHAPIVSFADAASGIHQTGNAAELHALLDGREALSLSGHTHSTENHSPGQHFAAWEIVGVSELPFRHIVAGATSGNWWQGDYNLDGDAQSLQRDGAPKGWLSLEFDGTDYRERYFGSRLGERAQWVDFNTPAFRDWFDKIAAWRAEDAASRNPMPPVTVNDLPDTRILTPGDLEEGVFLTVNFWHGSAESEVEARIANGPSLTLARTQQGEGEEVRTGAEFADPFAVKRQATVGRAAYQGTESRSRDRGYESFRGRSTFGVPQPQGMLADRSMHIWQAELPADLPLGVHRMEVVSTDRHGEEYREVVIFEVREERPAPRHRTDLW